MNIIFPDDRVVRKTTLETGTVLAVVSADKSSTVCRVGLDGGYKMWCKEADLELIAKYAPR